MALNPVLVIKVMDGNSVGVRARLKDDYVEHEIVLNSVLAYYWANDFPPVVKFLELFESVIKRTINELMPHKNLNLKYENEESLSQKTSCSRSCSKIKLFTLNKSHEQNYNRS